MYIYTYTICICSRKKKWLWNVHICATLPQHTRANLTMVNFWALENNLISHNWSHKNSTLFLHIYIIFLQLNSCQFCSSKSRIDSNIYLLLLFVLVLMPLLYRSDFLLMLVRTAFCVYCFPGLGRPGRNDWNHFTPTKPTEPVSQVVTCHTQTWRPEHRNSTLNGPPHTTHNGHSWVVRWLRPVLFVKHTHLTSAFQQPEQDFYWGWPGDELTRETRRKKKKEQHKIDMLQRRRNLSLLEENLMHSRNILTHYVAWLTLLAFQLSTQFETLLRAKKWTDRISRGRGECASSHSVSNKMLIKLHGAFHWMTPFFIVLGLKSVSLFPEDLVKQLQFVLSLNHNPIRRNPSPPEQPMCNSGQEKLPESRNQAQIETPESRSFVLTSRGVPIECLNHLNDHNTNIYNKIEKFHQSKYC